MGNPKMHKNTEHWSTDCERGGGGGGLTVKTVTQANSCHQNTVKSCLINRSKTTLPADPRQKKNAT